MKRWISIEELRSPEGYERVMSQLSRELDGDLPRLSGKLMRGVICYRSVFAPGQISEVSLEPLQQAFQLDYVMVPDEVCYDPVTKKPRLFYYHPQIRKDSWGPDFGSKFPASLVLRPESARVQQVDFFDRKTVYRAGQVIVIGTFENVSRESLEVRMAVVGYTEDHREEVRENMSRRRR